MRSPVLAMLWENWRLTRAEAAGRLAVTIVGGSVVLVLIGLAATAPNAAEERAFGATVALGLIASLHSVCWLSIAKLNGGRFLDGYRPGFPLHLLYTRPVRTAMLVGVPMAYQAVAAAALYLVSALLLRVAFGYPFPLLSVAAWIAILIVVQAAAYWVTRNRIVQWIGTLTAYMGCVVLALRRAYGEELEPETFLPDRWPMLFDFSLADYALIASIGLVSFGLAVVGVARQRHGAAPAAMPRTSGLPGPPDWLGKRFPCPTSSATRAQLWFDLRSSGLPLLASALALAAAIPLLYAVSGPVTFVRPFATGFSVFFLLVVLFSGGNAFGIRRRQGRTYASAFEATQACGTAGLAGLKVLVRAACLLAALIVVGASVWASLSLVSGWGDLPRGAAALLRYIEQYDDGSGLVGDLPRDAALLLRGRHAIEVAVGALTVYQQAALAVVAYIGIAVTVALRATLAALWARYPRRVTIAGSLLLLYGLVFVLLALVWQGVGADWRSMLDALFRPAPWIAAAAIVLATVYLFRQAFSERLLTVRQAFGAVLVSAAFGAAWITLLRAADVQLAGMPVANAAWMLSPALLPLTAGVLALWSFSRIRHT